MFLLRRGNRDRGRRKGLLGRAGKIPRGRDRQQDGGSTMQSAECGMDPSSFACANFAVAGGRRIGGPEMSVAGNTGNHE